MKRTVLVVGVVLLVAAGRAFAHHSFSSTYDPSKVIEVEGTLFEVIWRNPHSFLRMEVPNDAGEKQMWTMEWGSVTQLSATKYPVTRTTLRSGDRLIVRGEAARDPSATRVRISSVKRPIDGWEWHGVVE
jgi:hypothetical protein